ncbi:hypothetical protein ATO67_13615 [Agrobacterium bohemicum]|uniref:Uncharacterized protein n=1 Tax=Agrobacterium bohemicum TaxID=2052828 RepID=A0A135NY16_9HYPH|nr:hypothetical protein ATO67_13615 [Agrobacterium bohemicum]
MRQQQFKTIESSANFGFEVSAQNPTVSSSKLVQTLAAISIYRLVISHTLGEQRSFDAVDVENTFSNQRFPLPPDPADIFLIRCEQFDHRAGARLATFPCHQCADQDFAIDAISFGPTMTARHGYGCSLDNMALYPVYFAEHPPQPEGIKPDLLNPADKACPFAADISGGGQQNTRIDTRCHLQ